MCSACNFISKRKQKIIKMSDPTIWFKDQLTRMNKRRKAIKDTTN